MMWRRQWRCSGSPWHRLEDRQVDEDVNMASQDAISWSLRLLSCLIEKFAKEAFSFTSRNKKNLDDQRREHGDRDRRGPRLWRGNGGLNLWIFRRYIVYLEELLRIQKFTVWLVGRNTKHLGSSRVPFYMKPVPLESFPLKPSKWVLVKISNWTNFLNKQVMNYSEVK